MSKVYNGQTHSDRFTTAASGIALICVAPKSKFTIQVVPNGAVSSWTVVLEGCLDGINFENIMTVTGAGASVTKFTGANEYPCYYFRSRCTAITLGAGTDIEAIVLGVL